MKLDEKIDKYVNEEDSALNEKQDLYENFNSFQNDPLFQDILSSKNKNEFEQKMKKLKDERGEEAVDKFTEMLKTMKK